MPPEVVAAAVVVTLIAGGMAILESTWKPIRRYLLHRRDPAPATVEDVGRVESKLEELQRIVAAPPPGSPPTDTRALAAQATVRTLKLLTEAVELQRQHKEREAIERLLTAYNMNLPPPAKVELHLLAGNGFVHVSEFAEAEGHYLQALQAARAAKYQEGEAAASGGLGIVYDHKGDLQRARESTQQALAIADELGNPGLRGSALVNLGNVYADLGELEKAQEHYLLASEVLRATGNRESQAHALGNLGMVYGQRGKLDEAEQYIRRSLEIREDLGDSLGQASDLGNLGILYAERGDPQKCRGASQEGPGHRRGDWQQAGTGRGSCQPGPPGGKARRCG